MDTRGLVMAQAGDISDPNLPDISDPNLPNLAITDKRRNGVFVTTATTATVYCPFQTLAYAVAAPFFSAAAAAIGR